MAKSNIIATVSILSNALADTVSANNFYDEVVRELGRTAWLTNFSIVAAIDFSNTIALPAQAIDLHGVIYDNRWLHESSERDLEAYRKDWRQISANGGPITYVLDAASHLDISLFPAPAMTGNPVVQTFGAGYPTGNCTLIYTEYRSTVPLWLEWPIALGVLAREFSRSSDHMDADATTLAQQLHDVMLMMVS